MDKELGPRGWDDYEPPVGTPTAGVQLTANEREMIRMALEEFTKTRHPIFMDLWENLTAKFEEKH